MRRRPVDGASARSSLLRNRTFVRYWSGVVFSEIGSRATTAAVLYHAYLLTGSSLQVGVVGLFQALAVLVLSPIGGLVADRSDRRRVLQSAQALSFVASLSLAMLTFAGTVGMGHLYALTVVNTAASVFERPARDAIIPALVDRADLTRAMSVINPSRELATLAGPVLAGLLIVFWGPGAVYLVDAVTYLGLILVLATMRFDQQRASGARRGVLVEMSEGLVQMRKRPILVQLLALDIVATVFGAYRVLLPELSEILGVGAAGYGVLSSMPAAGALGGGVLLYRHVVGGGQGRLVLRATAAYGVFCLLLAGAVGVSPSWIAVILALVGAAGAGASDVVATAIRHSVLHAETPDEVRGRVIAAYQIGSRGGPALGSLHLGAVAAVAGPVLALVYGGLVPIVVASFLLVRGGSVRSYAMDLSE